jgi:uroporphyrinogen decarboxylase
MPGPLLDTLKGVKQTRTPVWLMRQAGRYLPEYRALRAEKGGFLELVYDSEAAAEITIQPIRRFGFDGAILFSDILIVPHAMGQGLAFLVGEGPKLSPTLLEADLADFTPALHHFDPVYETVRLTRSQLPDDVTMLGFAGSPWTVATYMIAGEGSKDQGPARLLAYRDPSRLQAILDAIRHALRACRAIRALVDRVILTPTGARGMTIELESRFAAILALATGKPAPERSTVPMVAEEGLGRGSTLRRIVC